MLIVSAIANTVRPLCYIVLPDVRGMYLAELIAPLG